MFRKFKRWLEFNPPSALGWDGWRDFEEKFRKEAPIRYFFTNTLGKKIFHRIKDHWNNVRNWVAYRTTRRYHIIDTGLEPNYHEIDALMLHGCFSLLVDYVEQQCAWMQLAFDRPAMKKELGWRYYAGRSFRHNWRNRELGLQHLDWEMTLGDPKLPESEQAAGQAKTASDVKMLYLWWTEERPKRTDLEYPLEDTVGLKLLSDKWKKENPDKDEQVKAWAQRTHLQEEAWDSEDTIMLMKLVRIRNRLWT